VQIASLETARRAVIGVGAQETRPYEGHANSRVEVIDGLGKRRLPPRVS